MREGTVEKRLSVALWLSPCGCVPCSLSDQHGPRSAGSAAAALGQGLISWTFLPSSCFTLEIIANHQAEWDFAGNFFGFTVSVDV